MNRNFFNWLLFVALSLIWGSSFILMKIGLDNQLNPYQVAALRIVSAGLVLLPITIKYIRHIPSGKLLTVFLSGTLGSLLPAFLFCMAEAGIDSSLAGALNCLTPVFVFITGTLFFKANIPYNKITGIIIALTGSFLLLLGKEPSGNHQLVCVGFVVLATISYGFNVNMVSVRLSSISSLHIVATGLTFNAIPAMGILLFTGYFNLPLGSQPLLVATGAATLLGIAGTAIATVMFYLLIKRAGGIFASTVTYGIPFIAAGWGVLFGESFGWQPVVCLLIILLGVYQVNKRAN